MAWYSPILDVFSNPLSGLTKLVRVIDNLLRAQVTVMLGFIVVIIIVLVHDWGFSPLQRLSIIFTLIVLIVLIVIVQIYLVTRGDWLFSPYERSLGRGRHYGTQSQAKKRSTIRKEPKQSPDLSLGDSTQRKGPLPPGK